ncbi:GNAT family N-acetyltransferase [Kitasatospora sp. NPDC054939]
MRTIGYDWRGAFEDAELDALHAAGFGYESQGAEWRRQVERHSLGWVCARTATGPDGSGGELVGFVNVAWDGGAHAFLLDTVVAAPHRRAGAGVRLVELAAEGARAAGCQWLHVDFEEHLVPFYFDGCGFAPTRAGLLRL